MYLSRSQIEAQPNDIDDGSVLFFSPTMVFGRILISKEDNFFLNLFNSRLVILVAEVCLKVI